MVIFRFVLCFISLLCLTLQSISLGNRMAEAYDHPLRATWEAVRELEKVKALAETARS